MDVPKPTDLMVDLADYPNQKELHDAWVAANRDDLNFQVAQRRFLLCGLSLLRGYFDPDAPPTPKIAAVGEFLKRELEKDKDKPVSEQRKFLCYLNFTSALPFVRAELAKMGVSTTEISGGSALTPLTWADSRRHAC